MTARDHYDTHLANFYSWMVGDFDKKQREQEKFFGDNEIKPTSNRLAFDLGSGHGLQTISLLNLGFDVKAVDFNKQLLDELSSNAGDRNLEIFHDDILNFLRTYPAKAEVIVCMGDTLTHLQDLHEVNELITYISSHLETEGIVIFSFRDLTKELKAEQRFIPVKSGNSRILTCFLEYFPDHVMVHDILHEKQNDHWVQKTSAYPKLRLNEALISQILQQNNLALIKSETINGMIYLIGRRR